MISDLWSEDEADAAPTQRYPKAKDELEDDNDSQFDDPPGGYEPATPVVEARSPSQNIARDVAFESMDESLDSNDPFGNLDELDSAPIGNAPFDSASTGNSVLQVEPLPPLELGKASGAESGRPPLSLTPRAESQSTDTPDAVNRYDADRYSTDRAEIDSVEPEEDGVSFSDFDATATEFSAVDTALESDLAIQGLEADLSEPDAEPDVIEADIVDSDIVDADIVEPDAVQSAPSSADMPSNFSADNVSSDSRSENAEPAGKKAKNTTHADLWASEDSNASDANTWSSDYAAPSTPAPDPMPDLDAMDIYQSAADDSATDDSDASDSSEPVSPFTGSDQSAASTAVEMSPSSPEIEADLIPPSSLEEATVGDDLGSLTDAAPQPAIAPLSAEGALLMRRRESGDPALEQRVLALRQEEYRLRQDIATLQTAQSQLLKEQLLEAQQAMERFAKGGIGELEQRKRTLEIAVEQLERRQERIRTEMRTTFAGTSQDLAIRVQGFKDYLVGSLQELVTAADELKLAVPTSEPEAPRRSPGREVERSPRNRDETPNKPQFSPQGFEEQARGIRKLLEQYRSAPDYYGPPWQLRRTFEPIHAERVSNWFFTQGGRGAVRTMGSRLQNILVASASISVLRRMYGDRLRTLVLSDSPERLGEWRRGLQDCLGIARMDFGSDQGVILFDAPEPLAQRADRLIKQKQMPLIIIDESEDVVNLSLLQFPLWLAFASDPNNPPMVY
jgi:hypothetical protein